MEENKKPENPQAFAYGYGTDVYERAQDGMTLRDYFAAKAMNGITANPDWMKEYKGDKYLMQSRIVAEVSYGIADAMLKQREL